MLNQIKRKQLLFLLPLTIVMVMENPIAQEKTDRLASAKIIKENNYPNVVQVGSTTLKLLGVGLREKWFLDIYTMGAYSESGACDVRILTSSDEIKYIRIDTLRDVSAGKIVKSLGKAFDKNMPTDVSEELKSQINIFLGYFKQDLAEQESIELIYVPGLGTTLKTNGKQQGLITPGKAFSDVLWSAYFSSRTCCRSLREQILSDCSK